MVKRKLITVVCMSTLVLGSLFLMERCKPASDKQVQDTAGLPETNAFVGEVSCQPCHTNEFVAWQQSHHFKAMMPANDSTVLGNFNDASYTADGVISRFFKKDGKYYINTEGQDGKNHDFEVKYTFGFTPLQQYLVEFPGGRMQATRLSWDVTNKKWFHQYSNRKIHHGDWLHWTRNAQNWNTMCANCHSTNLKKNYNIDADTYGTTWSILNVSCESCHGPGKAHIDYINSESYKKGDTVPGSRIMVKNSDPQIVQVNSCAYCHARRSEVNNEFVAGKELMDYIIPDVPTTESFHADGQVDDEDYIYTSFLQSKMFRHGVKCSHCHDPHSGKRLFTGNTLCMQCHEKKYDAPAHTFHAVNTKGAECVSCHMPGKFYMENDYRHDHSFRIPRPDLSVKYGTPNACNNCHNNKTAQWAAAAVDNWYGTKRPYHFSEDLVPGSRLDASSEKHLLKLLRDTAVPSIIRATAVHYLGNVQTNASLSALLNCLTDTSAQVRYRALRSLNIFPAANWMMQVGSLLNDPVKAVRIAAAELYVLIPAQDVPAQFNPSLLRARSELDAYLRYQADFSVGNLQIADHYLRLQDYYNAEKFYQRALRMDSQLNYARFNLSSAYNAQGRNQDALRTLKEAQKTDPTNERIYYNLALLYSEMNDTTAALQNFEKAVALKSNNPRLYYNYGLLLMQQKSMSKAESIFLKGLSYNNNELSLHYALAHFYLTSQQLQKALPHGKFLKQYDGNNPNYAGIFRALRL